jgi:hypothetical protein
MARNKFVDSWMFTAAIAIVLPAVGCDREDRRPAISDTPLEGADTRDKDVAERPDRDQRVDPAIEDLPQYPGDREKREDRDVDRDDDAPLTRKAIEEIKEPIDAVAKVFALAPKLLFGKRVNIPNAEVRAIFGDRTIRIGDSDDEALLVHLAQPVKDLREGQRVNIVGTLRQMPEKRRIEQKLHLTGEAVDDVAGEAVYLEATRVTPIPQT